MGSNVFDLDAWLAKKRGEVPQEGPATLEDVGVIPGMQSALQGALERSTAPDQTAELKGQLGRMGSFGPAPTQEDIRAGREANLPALMLGAAAVPALAAAGPAAALRALALSGAGAAGGGYLGRLGGKGLEYAGFPEGTAEILGKVGGVVGGLAAPLAGPAASAAAAETIPSHSVTGSVVKTLLRRLAGPEASKAATTAAEAGGSAVPSNLVRSLMRGETNLGKMSREAAEKLAAQIKGQAPRRAKDAATIAQEVAAARRASEIGRTVGTAVAPSNPYAGKSTSELVLKAQQAMSMPGGKEAILEWLKTQPAEVVAQIEPLLARGASRMGTAFVP